ncbi:MAG TPA: pilus assembly protein PilM [Candidatus Omnitrophota bacterium]|nr:pilus assembly protein PilM [Candidatus Omnitrophota bacterium]
MSLLPTRSGAETSVGLDFNHSQVFGLELGIKKGRHAVSRFASEPCRKGSQKLDEVLLRLFEKGKFSSHNVNIALSGSVVLVRFIEYPKMSLEELRNSMKFQIEQYIPFQADDVITDYHILGDSEQNKKDMRVILVAAKKTEVMSLLENIQKAYLSVQTVDIHALACLNAFLASQPEGKNPGTVILLDIGQLTSAMLVLKNGEPMFVREIALGNQEVLELFRKKMPPDTDFSDFTGWENAVKASPAAFSESVEPLFSQIRLSVNYFLSRHTQVDPPKMIYLSGDLCEIPEIAPLLEKTLGFQARTWDCMQGADAGTFAYQMEHYRSVMPVAMGLALRREG